MSDTTMEISVIGDAVDPADLPDLGGQVIDALTASPWGPPATMSHDQGDWVPYDADGAAIPERVPHTIEVRDASGRWRASLSCTAQRSMFRSSLRPPFGDGDRDEAVRLLRAAADVLPGVEVANVRVRPDPFAVRTERSLPALPGPFERALDWIHLLPPQVDELVDRDALLKAPAYRIEPLDGWLLLQVYEDPSQHSDPATFDMVEAVTRHLLEHLRS